MKNKYTSIKLVELNNLALKYQDSGDLQKAESLFFELLKRSPKNITALYNLGCLYLRAKNYSSAISKFVAAINICGFNDDIFFNLKLAIASNTTSVAEMEKAINELKDNLIRAFFLAELYFLSLKFIKSLHYYSKCIDIVVRQQDALANIFFSIERLKSTSKTRYFREQLRRRLVPDITILESQFTAALKLKLLERQDTLFKLVSKSQDISDSGRISCATYLRDRRRKYEAMSYVKEISRHSKEYINATEIQALIHLDTGKADIAIILLEKILEKFPTSTAINSSLIFAMDLAFGYTTDQLQRQRLRFASFFPRATYDFSTKKQWDGSRKLRIGYMSGDFFMHSASKVFGHLIFFHDSKNFDVFCYSNRVDVDDDIYTKKFKKNSYFKNIYGLRDTEVVDLVRRDELDILVDLSGHSGGNRLPVFAQRCAPIQISAWGYIGGTGLQEMDYIIADDYLIKPEEVIFYRESVVYAPRVVAFYSIERFPAVTKTPALSSRIVTFGSFNRLAKINDRVITIWSAILNRIPRSVLFIKSPDFDEESMASNFIAKFLEFGIPKDRIIIGGSSPWFDHLTTFRQVDISLDPFPHGGGVTTLESLMMGVPVVCLAHPTVTGRLSGSLLSDLGLTDWIATDETEYIEIACKMSANLGHVAKLRMSLRDKFLRSNVGSYTRYTRFIEAKYLELVCLGIARNQVSRDQANVLIEKVQYFIELKYYQNAINVLESLVIQLDEKAELLNTIGVCYKNIGNYSSALEKYKQALQINPNFSEVYNNIGLLLQKIGKAQEAEDAFLAAIRLSPDNCSQPLNNLGVLYRDKGRYFDSLQKFFKAISLNRDIHNAAINMCAVLREVGSVKDSVAGLQNICNKFPDDKNALVQLAFGLDLLPQTTLADAHRVRKQLAKTFKLQHGTEAKSIERDKKSKVHIGYVSGDFRRHSASKVFGGLVCGHDRSRFLVSCFANQSESVSDEYTAFFQSNVDNFLFVHDKSDSDLADMILRMGVDILVDLSCITHGNRLSLFALKPAPVQLSGWGYLGGCGISQIDFVVGDEVLLPPGDETNFPEKFLRLKSALNYFCIEPLPDAVSPPCIFNGYVTYGSFNRISKISDLCLEVWSKIAKADTSSRFVFKSAELSDLKVRNFFADKLVSFGFELSRVLLVGGTTWAEHMAYFNTIDLSLDPFPHGGGVSTLESIVMGVPVLALRWPTLVGRLSSSILINAGLGQFVFEESQFYIEKALLFSAEVQDYVLLRKNLRQSLRSSIVFNTQDYVNDVEQNYLALFG